MSQNRLLPLLVFSLLFASCSAHQVQIPQLLSTTADDDRVYVLEEELTIKAKKTAPLTLRAGTRWSKIGSIEQGDVFDTKDQVVIVNSFDVHEASIVVRNGLIVGYYLTVEKTIVETDPVQAVLIWEERQE